MGARLKIYLPALFVWVIMTLVNALKWLPQLINGELPGNDDYMRLVQVRDFLDGQSWTNLTQDRLYPADPLLSHWARLSDIIIGGFIKLFTPLFGAGGAEIAALIAVPSLLLLITLILLVAIARRLSDSEWMPLAVAMTAGLYVPLLTQFSPGRIDHHGLQLVLAAGAILALLKSDKALKWAVISGGLCAVSLWTGLESLPFIGGMFIAAGLVYVLGNDTCNARLRGFGLGYIIALPLLFVTSLPHSRWFVAACDALSPVYILLTGGAAIALIACTYLPLTKPKVRLLVLGALGALVITLTLTIFPHCLKGPYAELDPRLSQIWLANVEEAKPLLTYIGQSPLSAIALCIVPVFALIAVMRKVRKTSLWTGLVQDTTIRSLAVICGLCLIGSLLQLRLVTFAGLAAAPLAAMLMVAALDWAEKYTSDIKRAFIRAGLILVLSPIPFSLFSLVEQGRTQISNDNTAVVSKISQGNSIIQAQAEDVPTVLQPSCKSMRYLKALNQLPAGLAVTQIDMGAPVLASTQDLAVTSAPYHRNEAGNIAALDIFMGSAEIAKTTALAIKADYVITCKDYPETALMLHLAPNGLLAELKDGTVPNWLTPITLDNDAENLLLIYKVTP